MIKEALEYILGQAENKTYEIDGMTWSDHKLVPVHFDAPIPFPGNLRVGSLDAIIMLIRHEACEILPSIKAEPPLFIRIDSPTRVTVLTRLNKNNERCTVYTADQEDVNFQEGWRDPQRAIIELRSRFLPNDDSAYLISLLSKIKNGKDIEVKDNGVSQSVTVQQGISLVGEEQIKPRVKLCPFRTFREVGQPESEFVFRVSDDGNVGLFEADGGVWKMEAKDYIRAYLVENLASEILNELVVVMV